MFSKNGLIIKFCQVVFIFGVIFPVAADKNTVTCTWKNYITININNDMIYNDIIGNSKIYVGPQSFDIVPQKNEIYLINASRKAIIKINNKGEMVWKTFLSTTPFDIKYYNDSVFSFDGRKINCLTSDSGKPVAQINLNFNDTDVCQIGNICQFYDRFLFMRNIVFNDNINDDEDHSKISHPLLFVYDLKTKKMSDRIPYGMQYYPISHCSKCDSIFIKSLFNNSKRAFHAQNEKFILYSDINPQKETFDLYIFIKDKNISKLLQGIPFKNTLCLTTIRPIIFIADHEFVCLEIVREDFKLKQLKFYKVHFSGE